MFLNPVKSGVCKRSVKSRSLHSSKTTVLFLVNFVRVTANVRYYKLTIILKHLGLRNVLPIGLEPLAWIVGRWETNVICCIFNTYN